MPSNRALFATKIDEQVPKDNECNWFYIIFHCDRYVEVFKFSTYSTVFVTIKKVNNNNNKLLQTVF